MKNFELWAFDIIHENNPCLTVVLGDFNSKCTNWSKADITYFEGSMIDYIASSYGLNQLIQEPLSSYTDLIVTLQPNLVMESGIQSLLLSNCHHQIIFSKFYLSIFYPPSYKRTMWYYVKKKYCTYETEWQWLVALLMKKLTFWTRCCSTKFKISFHMKYYLWW